MQLPVPFLLLALSKHWLTFSQLVYFLTIYCLQVHPTLPKKQDLLPHPLQETRSLLCFEPTQVHFSNPLPQVHLALPLCTCWNHPARQLSSLKQPYFFVKLLKLNLSKLIIHKFQPNISLINHLQQIFFCLK